MSALIVISGLMFVVGLYGMVRIYNGGPYIDAGPPMSMIFVGCFLMWFLSIVLFGVVLGMWIGGFLP